MAERAIDNPCAHEPILILSPSAKRLRVALMTLAEPLLAWYPPDAASLILPAVSRRNRHAYPLPHTA